jgi:hypothetical protein
MTHADVASRPLSHPKPRNTCADTQPGLTQVEPEWGRLHALPDVEAHSWRYSVKSMTAASAAFFLTDSMPFFALAFDS